MRKLTPLASLGLLALAACSPRLAEPAEPEAAAEAPITAPAGEYVMDLAHTSIVMRVSHIGISDYLTRFTRADGRLAFDPSDPAGQSVTATIDAGSLQTDYPDPEALDFDTLVEKEFLDAAAHPTINFRSTRIEPTGPRTARVVGDLTFRGVTRPVTLETRFNGGYPPNDMDPAGARIGFSARGVLKRSEFGSTYGLPPPGSTVGVGDEVEVLVETEFTRKP